MYELETPKGEFFSRMADIASEKAKHLGELVVFFFNGIECRVDQFTDPRMLERDYKNCRGFGRLVIGPVCRLAYPKKTTKKTSQLQLVFIDTKGLPKPDCLVDWPNLKSKLGFLSDDVLQITEFLAGRLQLDGLDETNRLKEELESIGYKKFDIQQSFLLLVSFWRHGEELKKHLYPNHQLIRKKENHVVQ